MIVMIVARVHACVTMVMIVVHGVAIPIHVVLWCLLTMVTLPDGWKDPGYPLCAGMAPL